MIDYRPFRNTDPPAICEIWRNHAPLRALFQPLTPPVLELTVLSKPFFDRDGFIVATEDHHPIGFVHAGFSCCHDGSQLDRSIGGTCMLMLAQPQLRREVARELLQCSEAYLQRHGVRQLFGGGSQKMAPFYLGLYGGTTVPGVLCSDSTTVELFREAGYGESVRRLIMQRQLAGFRPLVDRQQIQLKRSLQVQSQPDPPSANWWEACTEGLTDRYFFTATPRLGGIVAASAVFWDVEPLSSSWGVHARGLTRLEIHAPQDRKAIATFLIGEALRLMAADGATLAEVHCSAPDDPLLPILIRLGFQEVEQAIEFVKQPA